MPKLMKEGVLGETKLTFVNDRRVLTIVSTYKRKVKGSVVGSSKTGSLTYIEPQVNVELNNELELLTDDERKEIFRILQVLTREISQFLPLIIAYQELLTELECMYASDQRVDILCETVAKAFTDYVVKNQESGLSKVEADEKQRSHNMFMATYVLPHILEMRNSYYKELAKAIEKKWVASFKNSKIKAATYETVMSGFQKKFLGFSL